MEVVPVSEMTRKVPKNAFEIWVKLTLGTFGTFPCVVFEYNLLIIVMPILLITLVEMNCEWVAGSR